MAEKKKPRDLNQLAASIVRESAVERPTVVRVKPMTLEQRLDHPPGVSMKDAQAGKRDT